jgi:hypothetical protein
LDSFVNAKILLYKYLTAWHQFTLVIRENDLNEMKLSFVNKVFNKVLT